MEHPLDIVLRNKYTVLLISFVIIYHLISYLLQPKNKDKHFWIQRFLELPFVEARKLKKEFLESKFKDSKGILKHFEQLASSGEPYGKCILGYFFYYGIIVERNDAKCVQYFLDSKEDKYSQFFLKKCYKQGIGVKVNMEESLKYLILAAENDNVNAQNELGYVYMYPEAVGYQQYIKENDEKSFYWVNKAIENGSAYALTNMGHFHHKHKQYEIAFKYYKKAASRNDKAGVAYLGKCYKNGTGVEVNLAKAYKTFQEGVELGDTRSMFEIGDMYEKGMLHKKVDKEKAFKWYHLAAQKSETKAYIAVGRCYELGFGTESNEEKAMKAYMNALKCDPTVEHNSEIFKDAQKKFQSKLK
jgi:uncharacterized protein